MESLLTRLVTYKLMDGSGLLHGFFNQPISKLLFSLLLFISIIGSSLYVLRRTRFHRRSSAPQDNTHKVADPQRLLNIWIAQNQHICVNIMNLCAAFINCYTDRVKVPKGVKNFSYLSRVSSPVIYSRKSQPTVSANFMSIPVLITANRLSFSGERQGSQRLSHVKFSLSNFSLEVVLNLSFNNVELIALGGVPSYPHFSLSIESPDPLENAKQDLLCTIEDIVSNLSLIWKNADSLLKNQELVEVSKECFELFSDLDSKVIKEDEEVYSSVLSQNSHPRSITTAKEDTNITFELDANILTESVNPLPEAASLSAVPLGGHLYSENASTPNSESDDPKEIIPEPVVLIHNPSLKKRLNESIHRRHRRSASDFLDQNVEESAGTHLTDTDPTPLELEIHPTEEHSVSEPTENKAVPLVSTQRSLKVTDVSPLHERVAPNLASKNLLVKVVKADFIELKSSSDAYCVVELDEPYQRHATHVVPPSEQLFWDQHLLFGLNSNSKRAAFEVFELSKRRKSISRGYAEVYLPELLTSTAGTCSSQLLRCIPLDPKQHSSSTSGLVGCPSTGAGVGGGGVKWEYTSTPASSSASLPIRKPTVTAEFNFMERIMDDPFTVCKGRSGVGSPAPPSKLHAAETTSPASSSHSSLSQTAGVASDSVGVSVGTNTSGDRSSHGSKEVIETNGHLEVETPKDLTPTPRTESDDHCESRLQRSTSARGSRLFEPAFENLRLAETNAAQTNRQQHRAAGGFGGFRRKSVPRGLSSSFGGGSGGSSNVSNAFGLLGPSSQLAGVVAGLTAASVESSDASVDPSTAAAVASAVVVAAATGRSTSASAPLDRRALAAGGGGSGTGGPVDSLFETTGASTVTLGQSESDPLTDTVVRYAAPAANIAESLGTYSAQLPPKRSDAAGTRLMNFFKSKKKPQQPSGLARLLYLQNLESSEFDAISTEGYQRILHGDQVQKE